MMEVEDGLKMVEDESVLYRFCHDVEFCHLHATLVSKPDISHGINNRGTGQGNPPFLGEILEIIADLCKCTTTTTMFSPPFRKLL